MDFLLLQDFGTVRNGGFARDMAKMTKKKKCKVYSSLRNRRRRAAALPLKLSHVSTNQVTDSSHSSERDNRLWKLIEGRQLVNAFTYLNNKVSSREEIPDLAACRRLIDDLCKDGRTRMAARVIELLEAAATTTLDVRTYTVLIKGLCKAGKIDNAVNVFRRMEEECCCCCKPDEYSYTILIDAMFRARRSVEGMKLLGEMISKGFETDVVTRTVVVNGLCKEGRLDEALELMSFDGWSSCVGSYNVVMSWLCKAGRVMDAEKLLDDMAARNCSPSDVTFRMLIRTLCLKGLLYEAIALLESMMPRYGHAPDVSHYILVILSLCKAKKMGMAVEYVEVMISRGCYPNIAVFNTLATGLCVDGKVDAALDLFNELKSCRSCPPNASSYSIVIDGLSRFGRSDQALQLLHEMRSREGFEPTVWTYVRLFSGLIRDGRVDNALRILEEFEALQVEKPCDCYNIIINGLCSVGETDRAIDLLVYMLSKGCKPARSAYAALIEGLARAGFGREAMELLHELSPQGSMGHGWTKGVAVRIERICSSE